MELSSTPGSACPSGLRVDVQMVSVFPGEPETATASFEQNAFFCTWVLSPSFHGLCLDCDFPSSQLRWFTNVLSAPQFFWLFILDENGKWVTCMFQCGNIHLFSALKLPKGHRFSLKKKKV
jgi:hypothetical protein